MCLFDGWYFLFNNLFVKDNLLSIYCLFSIYDDGAHPDVSANGDTLSSLKKKVPKHVENSRCKTTWNTVNSDRYEVNRGKRW